VNRLKHEKTVKECFDIQVRGSQKREASGICPVCPMVNPALPLRCRKKQPISVSLQSRPLTVAILGGAWVSHGPARFLLRPPFVPPVFFLVSRLSSFGWHMQGCQMRFVKIPATLSTAPNLSCVVIRKQQRAETISIVKPQKIIWPILADSLHFGVCVTWQPHQGLRQQQQINFAEETVWQDSLQEPLWFEKFCVSSFWSYGKLFSFHNTGFRQWFSKYRPLQN